jgi:predicted DNA-binding transcriptional regulator AlpA
MTNLQRPDEWVSGRQLSEEWGIPERTLGQWRYKRIGPKFVSIGRHVRYRRADVDAWLAGQTTETTERAAAGTR